MTKKPSKDDALEALDFIINVLKEHEKDLDRLINELGKITERLGDTEEISEKVAKVEERLESLQNEVSNLISFLSAHPPTTPETGAASTVTAVESPSKTVPSVSSVQVRGPPVILRCKQWEDFKTLASHAETVSFLYKEADRTFQVDALKNGRIITYSGELPKNSELLKIWLTSELGVAETSILEGVLAIG